MHIRIILLPVMQICIIVDMWPRQRENTMATINARIDDDIKNQADEVLNLMNIFFCIDAFISESFILLGH